jgi:hypothetical protein
MSIELTKAEPFAAPVVESLSVRLLVDSFYDRFMEDAQHPLVKLSTSAIFPGTNDQHLPASGGCRCIWNPPRPAESPSISWISDTRQRC